jgi:hypothetical protein
MNATKAQAGQTGTDRDTTTLVPVESETGTDRDSTGTNRERPGPKPTGTPADTHPEGVCPGVPVGCEPSRSSRGRETGTRAGRLERVDRDLLVRAKTGTANRDTGTRSGRKQDARAQRDESEVELGVARESRRLALAAMSDAVMIERRAGRHEFADDLTGLRDAWARAVARQEREERDRG